MSNLLQDHIDDPIKKCVVGMALLGFSPMMSCCGFSYKEEKIPKKHLNKAYIYLSTDETLKNSLGSSLINLSLRSGWDFKCYRQFIDFYANTWDKSHPWNDINCPHFHETFILGISSLEKVLIDIKQYFKSEAIIKDGNAYYKENVSKYWQYDPAEDWIVTPKTFDEL